MTERDSESFIDKVKNAFGMGDRAEEHAHRDDHDHHDTGHTDGVAGIDGTLGETANRPPGPDYAGEGTTTPDAGSTSSRADEAEADRADGWAGVDDALGGTTDRPAGPDYGATDADASSHARRDEDL